MKTKIAVFVLFTLILTACVSQGNATPPILGTSTPEAQATAAPAGADEGRATEFPRTAQEFFEMIYVACPQDVDCLNLTVEEISACPGERTCWRALREKDINAHITPYMGKNPSGCLQDGWMHSSSDRNTLGRKAPKTAVGSGIPAGYAGLIEGFTMRACPQEEPQVTPEVSPTPTATQTQVAPAASPTATPTAAAASSGFPSTKEELARVFSLDLTKVSISGCPGESACWSVKSNTDFFAVNP